MTGPNHPTPAAGYTSPKTGTGTYTQEDFTYVRKKRGRIEVEADPSEEGEINIVPYLDIMVNLIMFILVAQATLVSLGVIDVTAPTYANVGPGPSDQDDSKPKLRLTVGIAKDGFFIAAKGGVLPGEEAEGTGELTKDGVEKNRPTVPVKADGTHDFASLRRKLRGIKDAFPDTTAIYVAAEEATPYEIIVKTLDYARSDRKGELFASVAFTQIN